MCDASGGWPALFACYPWMAIGLWFGLALFLVLLRGLFGPRIPWVALLSFLKLPTSLRDWRGGESGVASNAEGAVVHVLKGHQREAGSIVRARLREHMAQVAHEDPRRLLVYDFREASSLKSEVQSAHLLHWQTVARNNHARVHLYMPTEVIIQSMQGRHALVGFFTELIKTITVNTRERIVADGGSLDKATIVPTITVFCGPDLQWVVVPDYHGAGWPGGYRVYDREYSYEA